MANFEKLGLCYCYVSKLSSLGMVDINNFFSDESAHANANLLQLLGQQGERNHKMQEPDKISSCLCMSCDDQHLAKDLKTKDWH